MIQEEIERRTLLYKALDALIALHFSSKSVLKRGQVQEALLNELGLLRTRELCILINERMRLAGYRTVKKHGALVYKE